MDKVLGVFTYSNWKEILTETGKKKRISCVKSWFIYRTESWPLKVHQKANLCRNEMSMTRCTCGSTLKERKKNTQFRELLGLKPVSLVINRG